MSRNVVLIGFMGAGKSAVGRALAGMLSRPFVDTDDIVEEKTGRRIGDIFAEEGEAAFRRLEAEAVKEAAGAPGGIVSVGGGAVLDPANVAALRRTGVLVYLKADAETLYRRAAETGGRPLLEVPEPKEMVKGLLEEREAVYEQMADITVETRDRSVEETAEEVRGRLDEEA